MVASLATPNNTAELPPNNLPEYDLEGTNKNEGGIQEAVDQEVEIVSSSSEYESSEEDEETEEPVQQPTDQEIDLTKEEIKLSSIAEVLETVLEECRTLSLDSPSSPPRENSFLENVSEESTPVIT